MTTDFQRGLYDAPAAQGGEAATSPACLPPQDISTEVLLEK